MTVEEAKKMLITAGVVAFECEGKPWAEYRLKDIPEKYNHREIEFIEAGNICIRLKEEEHEA